MGLSWNRVDSFNANRTSPYRPCPVCGSIQSRTITVFNGFQFFTDSAEEPKRADVCQCLCLDCFALFMNPGYSSYGFKTLFAEAGCSYGSMSGRADEQRDWLDGRGLLGEGKRVLDVGCYDGGFLSKLPENVLKTGVDIDGPAILRGRERHARTGIEFIHGAFETFDIDKTPDLITVFHVLEHLPGPVEVLKKLRAISHAGTKALIEVPILENGATKDINGFFSVQHMTHFSKASLGNALKRAGWRVVEAYECAGYNGFRVLAMPGENPPSPPFANPPLIPPLIKGGEGGLVKGAGDIPLLHAYLSEWHRALFEAGKRIERTLDTKRWVVWGGGMHTEFLYHTTSFFHAAPEREYMIVDGDRLKQGRSWRGIRIYGPSALSKVDWSVASLLISSYGSQNEIAEAAISMNVPQDRITTLYDDVRVY
ncbi:MAG: class I SAM-dependent methyltransferase [Deltaproteobacteria bacterium]|nr:class I SAM-dependent methyltransferase [Deltaproteobacteria bacterium]